MSTLQEKIAVMQAAERGEAIQSSGAFSCQAPCDWEDDNTPNWDWDALEYRVKPEPRVLYANEFQERGLSTNHYRTEDAAKSAAGEKISKIIKFVEVLDK